MVRKSRKGDLHWILTGAQIVWVPAIAEQVTTKRAFYAAYRGSISSAEEVYSSCGMDQCVKPEHLDLRMSRSANTRAISMPAEVQALSRAEVYAPKTTESILPQGLTLEKIRVVKYLDSIHNTIYQIRDATGLGLHEIMKIRGGRYDQAIKNITGASSIKKAIRGARRAKRPEIEPPEYLGPTESQLVPELDEDDAVEIGDSGMTAEEEAWLKTIK